ncbi:MAG: LuxR C-terminal-related transcriptional regulator [Candidatus Promineifilaceae bacterium]|nr:LuxR C-terminal-related transcriptional regulator [Candidatus Promineifilaceae bacterium]
MPTHSNLPAQPTSFIGREDEIAAIFAKLDKPECRLLTLLGPGGIGKTRLAIELARRKREDYADGVFFVALQSLGTSTSITPAIAEAVGYEFRSDGRAPSQQLIDYLRGKQVLLLMDNVEHLLEGVSYLGDLLQAGPLLKILATSREALNLREEWLWRVSGLRLPTDAEVGTSDAVQLFAERAHQVNQRFKLSDEATGVRRVCRLVGGMPLAIELASSWSKTLSADEIATEIERGLELLKTPLRNMPERHRSLKAVFDGSWQLLSKRERRAFRQMAVFHSGCSRQAALTVTKADLWTLQALTDKSFIYRDPTTDRYIIHELLIHYGLEQLAKTDEGQTVRDAHLDYYAAKLEQSEAALKDHGRSKALNGIQADLDNVRAAWRWALQQDNIEAIDRMAHALTLSMGLGGRRSEGTALLREAMDQVAAGSSERRHRLRAKLQTRVVSVRSGARDSGEVEALLRDNLALANRYNDSFEQAICLRKLSWLIVGKQPAEALHLATRSLALFSETGDRWETARTHVAINFIYAGLGNVEEAEKHASQAYHLYQEIGEAAGMANALIDLGFAAAARGDWDAHDNRQREALALAQKGPSPAYMSWALGAMATSALFRGQFEEARRRATECIEIGTEINSPDSIAAALLVLSELAGVNGDHVEALQLAEEGYSAAHSVRNWYMRTCANRQLGWALCGTGSFDEAIPYLWAALEQWLTMDYVPFTLATVAAFARIEADLGREERAAELLGFTSQHPLIKDWLAKHPQVAQLRARLKTRLGPMSFQAAWDQASSPDLRTVAQELLEEFEPTDRQIAAHIVAANEQLVEPLTERELQLLPLLHDGMSNREIAEHLVVSVNTVKTHLKNLYAKLNVSSRTEAARRAQDLGLL